MSEIVSNSSAPRASLLGLPIELRIRIYRYVGQPIYRYHGTVRGPPSDLIRAGMFPLLETCVSIRQEVQSLHWMPPALELIDFNYNDINWWGKYTSREKLAQLSKVTLVGWALCVGNPMAEPEEGSIRTICYNEKYVYTMTLILCHFRSTHMHMP